MLTNCTCDGSHWFIVYDGSELLFYGTHIGQLTTGRGQIEYKDTEAEMTARIAELGLTIPEVE